MSMINPSEFVYCSSQSSGIYSIVDPLSEHALSVPTPKAFPSALHHRLYEVMPATVYQPCSLHQPPTHGESRNHTQGESSVHACTIQQGIPSTRTVQASARAQIKATVSKTWITERWQGGTTCVAFVFGGDPDLRKLSFCDVGG